MFRAITAVIILFAMLALCEYRINFTSSVPIGLYQKQHKSNIERGDFVAACLTGQVAIEAKIQGYLVPGRCPNNLTPILKQVIAVPGDRVTVKPDAILVNRLVNAKKYPAIHKLIRHWINFSRPITAKSYWLYGSNNIHNSWDSRYFGGVKREQILGIYKPIWVLGG